jgi:hypothetical protein
MKVEMIGPSLTKVQFIVLVIARTPSCFRNCACVIPVLAFARKRGSADKKAGGRGNLICRVGLAPPFPYLFKLSFSTSVSAEMPET